MLSARPCPSSAKGRCADVNLHDVQIKSAIDDALEWLEDNQEAEQDEYEDKLKDMQDKVQPIVAGAYGAAGGPGGEDDDDLGDHDEL